MIPSSKTPTAGFTLIEVLLVVVLISIFAGTAVHTLHPTLDRQRTDATIAEMAEIGHAIAGDPRLTSGGSRVDFGYVGDVGSVPEDLEHLLDNPGYATWNGPYLTRFEEDDGSFQVDAWGDEYKFDGIVIKSAGGPDENPLTLVISPTEAALISNTITGNVRDTGGAPPGLSYLNLSAWMKYPDGAGGMFLSTAEIDPAGRYSFDAEVPIGPHTLYCALDKGTVNDTISVDVRVYAGRTTHQDLVFGAPWPASSGSGAVSALVYVDGSAIIYGTGNNRLLFRVQNASEVDIRLDYLSCTYEKTAYYQRITVDGTLVANSPQNRYRSGAPVHGFYPTIEKGRTVEIKIEHFRSRVNYRAQPVDMRDEEFQFEFSDGSVMTFTPTGVG